MKTFAVRIAFAVSTVLVMPNAIAWGDEGHRVVAMIAMKHLTPAATDRLQALLQNDPDSFVMRKNAGRTSDSLDRQATWADYYRDSDRPNGPRYSGTNHWHYADIEIVGGSLDDACFDYPQLPEGVPASEGTADDCAVDKIEQFMAEAASPASTEIERRMAVKFLLHFVGDLHQPLHASDDHDRGGNNKKVKYAGMAAGSLHHYWDTEFVLALGGTIEQIVEKLDQRITPAKIAQWSSTSPRDWAKESFKKSKRYAYGELPAKTGNVYVLDQDYVDDAKVQVAMQLSRAGIRLASTLNAALK